MVCDKTLSCGHTCCGVKEEEKCLPCLNGCSSGDPKLKQDADDMCMICYTEGLSCAPCIQVWDGGSEGLGGGGGGGGGSVYEGVSCAPCIQVGSGCQYMLPGSLLNGS